MLHAIAPIQSIENLLDILFDFYVKNLNFQYQPDDPIYRTLVRGIQARWNAKANEDNTVQLRGSAVMSGLKTLFLERPGFMAHTCETLIRGIDSILRGEKPEKEDRWYALMKGWFEKKSQTERRTFQGRRQEHQTEFIATTSDRIYLHYAMEDGKVGLVIPRIRLTEIGSTRPILCLYQDTDEIYRESLSVTGNDLGLTTRRRFVALEDTAIDFNSPLKICGEIEYLRDVLYSSGSRLFREYLLLDESGNERMVKTGTAYLFASEQNAVDFSNYDGVIQENHPGQLYRMNLTQVGSVTVNGVELFADKGNTGTVRLYPNIRAEREATVLVGGKQYQIFSRQFTLSLNLPKGDNLLQYHVLIDKTLCELQPDFEGRTTFWPDDTPNQPHSVHVVDLMRGVIVREFWYMILPGFYFRLNQKFYLDSDINAEMICHYDDVDQTLHLLRKENSDVATAHSARDGIDFEIQLPTIHCSLGNDNAFKLPARIWKGDVNKAECVSMSLPLGWQGELMLGVSALTKTGNGHYELGNYLQARHAECTEQPLWLRLRSPEGAIEAVLLTHFIMIPTLIESPVERTSEGLIWSPKGRFWGNPSSRFHLCLSGPVERDFQLDMTESILGPKEKFPSGRYRCPVSICSVGLFSHGGEETLLDSELVIGDENEFRFEKKDLVLADAICWNLETDQMEIQPVRSRAAILSDMRYVGNSVPSGESVALPGYEAVLSFEMENGKRIQFNWRENNSEYELVNPAHVWIVNERRLILRTVTDDAVYLNMGTNTILNRIPDLVMQKNEQRRQLRTPDYFDYEIWGE